MAICRDCVTAAGCVGWFENINSFGTGFNSFGTGLRDNALVF